MGKKIQEYAEKGLNMQEVCNFVWDPFPKGG